MITLLTGAPGAGKSAGTVSMLMEPWAQGRPLFVDGIPDLKIDHQVLDASKWPESVPDGALVVIDEAQRVWRPSGPGQKIPDHVALLETHRHRGLDFIVVTQHPNLIHQNVRRLVGRHVHLRDVGILGRRWYEWPEASDPARWKSAPIAVKYRLPKKVFGQYKSASLHIKPQRKVPPAVIVLAVTVPLVAFLGYKVFSSFYGKIDAAAVRPAAAGAAASAPAGQPVPPKATPGTWPDSPAQYLAKFIPRIANDPGSAPAYDALRVVRNVPRVIGGFCIGDTCRCFTNQGTDPGMGDAACREVVKARPFDPFTEPPAAVAPVAQPAQAVASN